ncbi:ATP-binding cassette domain-containing protein [Breoghania sp.]|uniref:ATP-binding cassette domain-containing protein n=1 Tax=Breoghania sp. TaxID=2065378 RepID=UPI002AA80CB6|nr:ATP-binding cassette domain-containing protein [Breoghania sp.]
MTSPLLEFRDLSKRFGGVTALDHFNLHLDRGEILGLIGPNGSGKTTSFNLLTGIYRTSGGEVVFDGKDITNISARQVYEAGIVRTFQRSRLCLDLSIYDNIMIGNTSRLPQGMWANLMNRKASVISSRRPSRRRARLWRPSPAISPTACSSPSAHCR